MSRALRLQGVAAPARIPLLGLAMAGILPRITHIRPQLFSVFLFAALLLTFVKSERGSLKHLLWSVPILAFWTNLHGGWIVGLGTVAMWAAGLIWERREASTGGVIGAVCVAGALATLVNPYGVGLWSFLLETVRFGREAIEEWGPIWTYPPVLLLWIVFTTLLTTALWTRRIPLLSARALVAIAWCVASVRVSRLDSFFALSVVILIGPCLAHFFARPASRFAARLTASWWLSSARCSLRRRRAAS